MRNFTLYAAICCDVIWMKQNEVFKNNMEVDPRALANQINSVYENHRQGWEAKDVIERRLGSWTPPSPLCVEVNFDVAIGETTLA